MSSDNVDNAVPMPVQVLINVFKEHLSNVAFPDVSLEILEDMVKKVSVHAQDLQEALARAESAREALESGKNELLQKAARGLAYATIFAEGNDALLEQLSLINLSKTARPSKKSPVQKDTVKHELKSEEKSGEKKSLKPHKEADANIKDQESEREKE